MESRLYVGNLSDDVSMESLRKRFEEFGPVSDVHLATDRSSGRLRGHAFVTMGNAKDAHSAMTALDGSVFDDRKLRVNKAGEERDKSRAEAAERAKITSQFRERQGMVYELDCGGVALVVKMAPEDAREAAWRVEVSTKGGVVIGDLVVLTASATTRAAAFEEVVRLWGADADATAKYPLDWAAVTETLAKVRAL